MHFLPRLAHSLAQAGVERLLILSNHLPLLLLWQVDAEVTGFGQRREHQPAAKLPGYRLNARVVVGVEHRPQSLPVVLGYGDKGFVVGQEVGLHPVEYLLPDVGLRLVV